MSNEQAMELRDAILKTVVFFDTMEYPPTYTEVMAWMEEGDAGRPDKRDGRDEQNQPFDPQKDSVRPVRPIPQTVEEVTRLLITTGLIEEGEGRLALKGRLEQLLALVRERTALFPRKLRAARKVARWLARHPAVRFVALANTTSLAHARDEGDLDFFVVVRKGHIWTSRLLGGAPYRLTGRLSGPNEGKDAVCLSYFISDAKLDLSSHMLAGDDPYFRYWFLALLPLFDDGVSAELWNANRLITSRHPYAESWMTSPDSVIRRPVLRLPFLFLFENLARTFQMNWFPAAIRDQIGTGTVVMVSEDVLKFHIDDGRARYRDAYAYRLRGLGL